MRFPNYVLESVKKYISDAIARVDINRYNHETAYINAILAKLDGVAYHDQSTHIEFKSTIATDRGPNCAESKYGADFALTCNIMMPDNTIINKAVLGQAKKGKISELSNSEKRRLNIQKLKMKKYTKNIILFETPVNTKDIPKIIFTIINKNPFGTSNRHISKSVSDYLVDMLIGCKHGDRNKEFIDAVKSSHMSSLDVYVKTMINYKPISQRFIKQRRCKILNKKSSTNPIPIKAVA